MAQAVEAASAAFIDGSKSTGRDRGIADGARLLCGGERPADLAKGYFTRTGAVGLATFQEIKHVIRSN
ncbi:hypothetical protein PSAN_55020 [Pseudomonas antarctica]|uniref:Uncharacterized protein n=1 Tax=Pseudomonas antarctica TaxID=219572 RepID=A0ABQ6ZPD2_9PSED|nr:hypothetical protein PSAN_55020 [Pseudomonas antarctica]